VCQCRGHIYGICQHPSAVIAVTRNRHDWNSLEGNIIFFIVNDDSINILTELMSNSFSKSHQFVLWSFTADGGNQLRGILFPRLSENERRPDIFWLVRVSEKHFPIFCPILPCYRGHGMSRCIKYGINHRQW